MKTNLTIITLLTLGLASNAMAQGTLFQWSANPSFSGGPDLNAPLVTDRPDFTEASSTVGRGVVQLEFGYTYTDDGATGTENNSYGEPLLRAGILADWLELRVGWNYAEEISVQNGTRTNQAASEDLYLGFKIGLTPQEGILPEMSLIPQTTVPTGRQTNFGAGEMMPGLNWIYAWELTENISAAGSTQYNRSKDSMTNQIYAEFAQSWTFGYGLTENVGAYTEWYALFPTGADTESPEHYFNGGLTFLLTNDIQWDVRAGVGLNNAADDYFIGSGFSVRVY